MLSHLVTFSPEHVKCRPLGLLTWLQPAHLDSVHESRHHLSLPAGWNKAALGLHHVVQWVHHRVPSEIVDVRLRKGWREERMGDHEQRVLTSFCWSFFGGWCILCCLHRIIRNVSFVKIYNTNIICIVSRGNLAPQNHPSYTSMLHVPFFLI